METLVSYELAHSTQKLRPQAVNLLGFEFDGTACFRKGSVHGPNAIRAVSDGIESYSPYLNANLEDFLFYDLGNLNVGKSDNNLNNWSMANEHLAKLLSNNDLKNDNVKLLLLGGEHSVSYAPIKHYLHAYPDLVLIHLDAHADLRDGYQDYHYSHASIIKRSLDHFGEQHQLIQYGVRSGTKEEYEWMLKNKTLYQNRDEFLSRITDIAAERPIYLTLDLDYFDPSFLPGTGTPEPGGEDFHSFVKLVKILAHKNLVGADVVELAPNIDPTGNSNVFATKVVRELILAMNMSNQHE